LNPPTSFSGLQGRQDHDHCHRAGDLPIPVPYGQVRPHRQCDRVRAVGEQGEGELVIGVGEGEEHGSEDPRHDEGQDHIEKSLQRVRAADAGRLEDALIQALEGGGEDQDRIRGADRDVGEGDAEVRVHQFQRVKDLGHPQGVRDGRNHAGQEDDGHQHLFARQVPPAEGPAGKDADHGAEDHGDRPDDEGILHDFGDVPDFHCPAVPVQRELRRQPQTPEPALADGPQGDHEERGHDDERETEEQRVAENEPPLPEAAEICAQQRHWAPPAPPARLTKRM
jgi:hypothetical protein